MTEYNIFCYSEVYGDDMSFQQKRYRAFNQQVTKERFFEIMRLINKILPINDLSFFEFWSSLTVEQWNDLQAIPEAFGFKEGFEYISSIKLPEIKSDLSGTRIQVFIGNKTYNGIIE